MPCRPAWRILVAALGVAAVCGYAAFLYRHVTVGVGGQDSSGYANAARLIRAGHIVEPIPALDALGLADEFSDAFTPLGFVPGPRPHTMVPYYPPGFPAHIALATLLAGDAGPFVVSPLAAAACLVVMFFLGRELGLPRRLAVAGAAALGGCAAFLFQAIQPMSDVVGALWVLLTILFALRARRRPASALIAGAAFGVAILVRPTNLLLVPALALALPLRPGLLGLFLAGGAPFAVFFALWNHAAFGGALQTGYSGQLGHDLALANFPVRAVHYGRWLARQLSPLVIAGWVAVGLPSRMSRRDRAMLIAWFAPLFLFYCFWGPYETWWYTRYLLGAVPALILGTVLVVRERLATLSGRGWWPLAACGWLIVGGVVAGVEISSARQLSPFRSTLGQRVFPEASRYLADHVAGQKAIVLSMELSGAMRYYTDLVPCQPNRLGPGRFARLRAAAAARHYELFAALLPQEIDVGATSAPAPWRLVKHVRGAILWRLDPDGGDDRAAAVADAPPPAPGGKSCGPTAEICNGIDDDCNGKIDDIGRVSYRDLGIPAVALQSKNGACVPTTDAAWLACNNAIHRYCRDHGCGTTGIGPLEWGAAGASAFACLAVPSLLDVSAADLSAFGACSGLPPLAVSDRFECARAIHGLCRGRGYASGFGPVDSPRPSTWSIVCLPPGSAQVVPTTYAQLRAFHDGCTGPDSARSAPTYCLTAAKRFCVERGAVVGFGPVTDPDGRSPSVVCLDDGPAALPPAPP